ncbi:hypothetical protein TRVA0_001S07294 [Trichomonascus vanleenenianus]|uniref:uncharacterized protein n=1 Tax=Trichomonascus vanleenenianus TaxID=2268995 RepID=UPI003EC96A68
MAQVNTLTPDDGDSLSTPFVSSTRASVDSDSDYMNDLALSTTSSSRPLSRSSSTFSALSTTATKDGVAGKRVRRKFDPMSYANWAKLNAMAAPPPSSSNASTPRETDSSVFSGELRDYPEADGDGDAQMVDPSPSLSSAPVSLRQQLPDAPPVTLGEKIQLLRTGSVSGKPASEPRDEDYTMN